MIMIMIHGMNNIIFMIAIYNAPLGFEVSPDRCCTQSHRAPWHLILVERPQEVSPAAAAWRSGQVSSRPPASQERPGPAASVPSRQTYVQKYPKLTIGADQLFCHQTIGDQPTTIHAAPLGTARVINTLLRVVHGGSSGWGSLPMGQPPTGAPELNDDPYPTENKDPKRRRIVFAGGDVAHARVSRDIFLNPTPSRRARKNPKNEDCKDEWVWKDEVTLVRDAQNPKKKNVCSQRS